MTVQCADKSIFEEVNFGSCDVVHVDWIKPTHQESLKSYAKRISQDFEKNAMVLGVSFGGMLAVEVAKLGLCRQVILISSAKTAHEVSFQKLANLVPFGVFAKHPTSLKFLTLSVNPLTFWLFGVRRPDHKKLFAKVLKNTDFVFFIWAIKAIGTWDNVMIPSNCLHIHGDKD